MTPYVQTARMHSLEIHRTGGIGGRVVRVQAAMHLALYADLAASRKDLDDEN
jgi:hypothetical protein